jgi:hypothetical protein
MNLENQATVVDTPQLVTPERAARGLATWLALLLVFGVGGLVFRMDELALMVALAGMFVLAQAADADPRWRYLHYTVSWVVPAGGLAAAVAIGMWVLSEDGGSHAVRMFLTPALAVAALVSVLIAFRPLANTASSFLFQTEQPTHTMRLTARITLVILVLAVPGWFALRSVFDDLFDPTKPLIDRASLEGQLIGYILLALAAVGYLIRRDLRATAERLGLGPLTTAQLGVAALGVVTLYGINAGADWTQQTFFHGLWESDHQVNQAIAAGLGPVQIVMLGLSAGVGEEITLRGALQPRLGLVMTSLLFASLHLQYSWFGIGVIFLLSLVLGIIRIRTNTTLAMAVHVGYDILALASV